MHYLKTFAARWFAAFYQGIPAGSSGLPPKSVVQAEFVRPVLGHVYIVERTDQGHLFRLFGTAIVNTIGVDNTWKTVETVLSGEDRDRVVGLLTRCLDEPVSVVSTERIIFPDRENCLIEILRCPFEAEDGSRRFVAGTLAATGEYNHTRGPKVIRSHALAFQRAETEDRMISLPRSG